MNQMNQQEAMNEKDAKAQGYRPLTNDYDLPKEQWMLNNVLADMERGNIDAVVVSGSSGVEVWRRAPMSK